MARITRKELKTDKFALEVEQTVDFVTAHSRDLMVYGSVAAVVIGIAAAVYFYLGHQQTVREQVLADAIQIQEAPVSPPNSSVPVSFPTEDAKRAAAIKAFSELASKYPGSGEATVAKYYLGAIAADQGRMDDAAKLYQEAAAGGDKRYASLARYALAQVYFGEGRTADGEKIMRDLMDHPTDFVSKEQATIALARGLAATKPAEARKLLEPLRTAKPGIVSQVAISATNDLAGQ